MEYRRCGNSGLLMPAVSLGLWHNFGEQDSPQTARDLILTAFDNGVTQFDLANNYGPPPGAAEVTFSKILKRDLFAHRNQMVITSKAGHEMWAGPYGDWGSRKHLIASCDESLARLGVDYLDIFYSHRYDPQTPLHETMGALDHIVRTGRAIYVGLSKYPADKLAEALDILYKMGTPVVVDQLKYSLLHREPEAAHFSVHAHKGIGCVSFSPLAQGQLSDRYVGGIPSDSRAARETGFLKVGEVEHNRSKVRMLSSLAAARGQSLSQMAIAWQLHDRRVTSVIIGASRKEQLLENFAAFKNIKFSPDELDAIDAITL